MVTPPPSRRDRPPFTQATRQALFIFKAAADAGFSFRAAGKGQLEILGPIGVDPAICAPVLAAIREHGSEIQRLVRWLADEADHGRIWSPRPEWGTRQ